jgi:glycine cleavage system aminomethyltransferase T
MGIGPGAPNSCERVESGLLSYGGDTDDRTNPYEVRLGRYIELHVANDVIGIHALRRIPAAGARRHQLGVTLEGDEPAPLGFVWHPIYRDGLKVGDLTNCTWSYRLQRNIGFALIESQFQAGDAIEVVMDGRVALGVLRELPFM